MSNVTYPVIDALCGIDAASPQISQYTDSFGKIKFMLGKNFDGYTLMIVTDINGHVEIVKTDGQRLIQEKDKATGETSLLWNIGSNITVSHGVVVYQIVGYKSENGTVVSTWYSKEGRLLVTESIDTTSYSAELMGSHPDLLTQLIVECGQLRTSCEQKVDREDGKGLSSCDYTLDEKEKLATVKPGAEVNVQSDWDETDGEADAFIKNKPNLTELESRLREEIELAGVPGRFAEKELSLHKNNLDVDIKHLTDEEKENILRILTRKDAIELIHQAVNLVNSSNPNEIANGSLGIGMGMKILRGQSLGVGLNNNLGGYRNIVAGNDLDDYNESCRAIFGRFNAKNGQAVLVVAWGTDDNNRLNVFTVDKNGNGKFIGNVYSSDGKLASEKYVADKIAGLVNGSPEALDTIYELAKALGDDPNFSATVMELIGQKADDSRLDNIIADVDNAVYRIDGSIDEANERIDALDRDLHPVPENNIPATLSANTSYEFGTLESLSLSFPKNANNGDVIYISFLSRDTATNLTVDRTNTTNIDLVPKTNTGYEVYAKYNQSIAAWIVKYSEYDITGR